MKKTSIIIPCAGKGLRLGIPYAKELFAISKGVTFIDCCIKNLLSFKDNCQIIIIISPEKQDLVKYLSKYSNEIDIFFVYQKSEFKELPGALYSSKELFSDTNLLFLPDIILNDKDINIKIRKMIEYTKQYQCCFGVKKENNTEILKKMGALKVRGDKIEIIKDKPNTLLDNFDSYWISIGWQGEKGATFLEDFSKLYTETNISLNDRSFFYNKPVVYFDYALDLGVWENINNYFNNI